MATQQCNVLLDGPRHLSVLFTGDGELLTTNILKVDRSATAHVEDGTTSVLAAGSSHTVPHKTLDVLGIEESIGLLMVTITLLLNGTLTQETKML